MEGLAVNADPSVAAADSLQRRDEDKGVTLTSAAAWMCCALAL